MEDLTREEMGRIWRALAELQRIDAEILVEERRLATYPGKAASERQRLAEREQALAAHGATGEGHERERRDFERQIREREEKIKRLQGQLFQVKTQREYDAIGVETEQIRREIGEFEDRELALIEAEERHVREEASLRESLAQVKGETEKEIARLEALRAEAERTIEVLRLDRPRHADMVPMEILMRYDTLRLRYPDSAVVTVVDQSCGGCRMALVNQTLLQVNLGQRFTVCEHCGRMLVPKESFE